MVVTATILSAAQWTASRCPLSKLVSTQGSFADILNTEPRPHSGDAHTMTSDTRELLRDALADALRRAQHDGALPSVPAPEIRIQRPQHAEHGDYACNLAMRLAGAMRLPPLDVAEAVAARVQRDQLIAHVEAARPGFINLRIHADWKRSRLLDVIAAGDQWGRAALGAAPERVQVEFVSANPTGPLQVGNGRGAVLGDALASVLAAAGCDVQREYYVNDAGAQIALFGRTLLARYQQAHGAEAELPEGGYGGAYMIDLAAQIAAEAGAQWLDADPDDPPQELTDRGLALMLDQIRDDLRLLGVEFDRWQSERALSDAAEDGAPAPYDDAPYDAAMALLREGGFVIEKDGAIWFRADADGADDDDAIKDNVLIRSSGEPTYFATDVAYHYDKFIRRGFDRVIDVWGADHQGHVARTKASVTAVGGDGDRLEVLLYQLVHLRRGRERVRMSKRTGELVTLRELVEEVGADAARFFLLQRSADAQMDFDLDAASSEDPRRNPVFYVQYAHARCAGILRAAAEQSVSAAADHLDLLEHEREDALINAILTLPELIVDMAARREPHHLTTYAQDLAQQFTQFYDACRVLDADHPRRSAARLTLVQAAKCALAATLRLIGVSAPDDM